MAALTPEEERRRYVTAFNSTMIKIWRERIALLKVIDTGALYRSTLAVGMSIDGKVTNITLSQRFNTYGIFQDYGTGREVPIGNPGDIGRDKVRQYNAPPKTDRFGAQDSNQKTLCRHGQQLKKTTWSGVQGQGGS